MAKHTSINELDGTAPVPSPITSPEAAPEQARARKMQLNVGAVIAPAEAPPDHAALGLNGEKARQAETLRRESLELGRKSTDSVFEWGRIVESLHAISDDQKHFEKLAKGVLNLSRTGAESYERVHQRPFTPPGAPRIRVGMIASGLYNLATAEPEKVEEVMAACEAGQKLNGARIKAIVGKSDAAATSPDEVGHLRPPVPGGVLPASCLLPHFSSLPRPPRIVYSGQGSVPACRLSADCSGIDGS